MPSLKDFQAPVPTTFTPDDDYALIDHVATTEGVDPAILRKMVETESSFNPKAVSPKGAQGLLQLMPGTAKEMGVTDPFDPLQNLTGGAKYFKKQLDAHGGDVNKALAAYNWGPGNLASGAEWPQETKDYVAKIGGVAASQNVTQPTPSVEPDFGAILRANVLKRKGSSLIDQVKDVVGKSGGVGDTLSDFVENDPIAPAALASLKESLTPVKPTGELPLGMGKNPGGVAGAVLDVAYGIPEAGAALVSGIPGFVGGQIAGAGHLPFHDPVEGGAKAYDTAEAVNKAAMYQPKTATGQLLLKPIEVAFGTLLGTVDKVVRAMATPGVSDEELAKRSKAAQYLTNTVLLGAPLAMKGVMRLTPEQAKARVSAEAVDQAKQQIAADPKVPQDMKDQVAATPGDVVSNVLDQVNKTQAKERVAKTSGPTVKVERNQEIVEGLRVEAELREGRGKAAYNTAARIVAEHPEDIEGVDLSGVKGIGKKTGAKIQEIIEQRRAREEAAKEGTGEDIPMFNEPPVETPTAPAAPAPVEMSPEKVVSEPTKSAEAVEPPKTAGIVPVSSNYSGPTLIGKSLKDFKAEDYPEVASTESKEVMPDGQVQREGGQAEVKTVDPVMEIPVENLSPRGKARREKIEAQKALEENPPPEFDTVKIAKEEGYEFPTKRTFATHAEALEDAGKRGEGHEVLKIGTKYRVGKYVEETYPEYPSLDALAADFEVGSEVSKERAAADVKTEGFGIAKVGDKFYRTHTKMDRPARQVELDASVGEGKKGPQGVEDFWDDGVTPEDWKVFQEITGGADIAALEAEARMRSAMQEARDATPSEAQAAVGVDAAAAAKSFMEWRDALHNKMLASTKKPGRAKKKAPPKEAMPALDDQFATFNSLKEAQEFKKASGREGQIIQDPMTKKFMIEPELDLPMDKMDPLDMAREEFGGEMYDEEGRITDSDYYEGSDGETRARNMWDVLNNERGSIDVTGLAGTIEAMEKMQKIAAKMGKTVDEYLSMMGVDQATRDLFMASIARIPQMRQEVKDKDPLMAKILLPEGPIVAQQFKKTKKGEIVWTMPPVPKALAEELLGMDKQHQWGKDVVHTDPKTGKVHVEHTTTAFDRFMEATETKIYSFTGPLKDIYHTWRDAKAASKAEKVELKTWLTEMKKQIAPERQKDFAIACYADMKSVKEALAKMGITDIPTLTPEELRVKEALLDYTRKFRERANYIRTRTGQKAIPQLLDMNGKENYLPLFRDLNVLRELGITEGLVSSTSSKLGQLSKTFNGLFNPHAKKRSVSDIPIELDPFRAIEKYAHYGLDEIHISPVAALAKELSNVKLPNPKGKGKITLWETNPAMAKMLSKWSDAIVGKDPVATALANMNPFISRGIKSLSNNLVVATIGGSLRTVFVQPTSFIVNAYANLDMRSAAYGIMRLMAERPFKGDASRARKMSSVLSIREAELMFSDMAEYMRQGVISGWKAAATDMAMAPMKWVDGVMAEATWNSAYYFGEKKLGLKGEELVHYADDVVEKTQGLGIKGAVSDLQTHQAFKWLTLLQTFSIADFNFIAREVLGIKNPDISNGKAMVRVAKYLMATALAGQLYKAMGYENVVPDPVGTYQQVLKDKKSTPHAILSASSEFLEKIPIIGGSAKYGSNLLGITGEWANLVPKAALSMAELTDWDKISEKKRRKDMLTIAKAVGTTMGIPLTGQMIKSINTAYNGGNPYEVIMGVYKEEKRHRKSTTIPSILK